jgi:hypothetical protein
VRQSGNIGPIKAGGAGIPAKETPAPTVVQPAPNLLGSLRLASLSEGLGPGKYKRSLHHARKDSGPTLLRHHLLGGPEVRGKPKDPLQPVKKTGLPSPHPCGDPAQMAGFGYCQALPGLGSPSAPPTTTRLTKKPEAKTPGSFALLSQTSGDGLQPTPPYTR